MKFIKTSDQTRRNLSIMICYSEAQGRKYSEQSSNYVALVLSVPDHVFLNLNVPFSDNRRNDAGCFIAYDSAT
ncbi:hypothetical protein NC651_024877 [Populus alba x Populus x berolinensis]|nr:hypothetical protein NC651_024877 [Populus alba x Populus x berolinensis]